MQTQNAPQLPLGRPEFVGLMALCMALSALSLDSILPALGQLAEDFKLTDDNRRQGVVTAFLIGFGIAQLFYGPISDSWGRKSTMLASLVIFICASLGSYWAPSFEYLLLTRVLQGVGAAGVRVLSVAVIRDCLQGHQMAQVMSFIMIVFITVPIFAPSLGALVVYFADWQSVFLFMAVVAIIDALWLITRLPETLREPRAPNLRSVLNGYRQVLSTPITLRLTLALSALFSIMMSYISSAQQIYQDVYGLGAGFPLAFGAVAAATIGGNVVNARYVVRLGADRLARFGMILVVAGGGMLVVLAALNQLPLAGFMGGMLVLMTGFALSVPNLNALAMEPLGQVAGTGSSFIGAMTTAISAMVAWWVGGHFDGTVLPVAGGMALMALIAGMLVWTTLPARAVIRD